MGCCRTYTNFLTYVYAFHGTLSEENAEDNQATTVTIDDDGSDKLIQTQFSSQFCKSVDIV